MNDPKNPLSPHLQIYRWQVSSLLSITHRITGILNLLGLIFISAWICSAGIGENLFEYFSVLLKNLIKFTNNKKKIECDYQICINDIPTTVDTVIDFANSSEYRKQLIDIGKQHGEKFLNSLIL